MHLHLLDCRILLPAPGQRLRRVCMQRGFTLVEILIVMVLLSLLTLGLASALSTISQTQQRVDSRLELLDQRRVASAFLRATLGSVSGQFRQGQPLRQGQSPFFFDGQNDSLQWLGSMPARMGLGGRMHFRLSVQDDDLVLQFAPWQGADKEPDWSEGQSQVLEHGVTALALRYQNARVGADHWQEAWAANPPERANQPPELPTAVHLQVHGAQGDWPLTVVALHIPAATNPSAMPRAAVGGSAQR